MKCRDDVNSAHKLEVKGPKARNQSKLDKGSKPKKQRQSCEAAATKLESEQAHRPDFEGSSIATGGQLRP